MTVIGSGVNQVGPIRLKGKTFSPFNHLSALRGERDATIVVLLQNDAWDEVNV